VFIIGKPMQMSGLPSESMGQTEAFVRSLTKQFPGIPVVWVDERFTSKMASRAIAMSGLKKKDRQDKALIDKVSAVIILQSYMENINNNFQL
jgi:putative Holliday junction resolvase